MRNVPTGTTFVNTFHLIYSANNLPIIYSNCVEHRRVSCILCPTSLYAHCVVFLYTTDGQERVSVYCRHVAVIAEAIKCRYSDSCSGSFIKWWRERESWKDEANRRGCKSAEEGSAEVDETFPGRLPPGSSGPRWPSDVSPFSSLRSYFMPFSAALNFQKRRVWTLWLHRKSQIQIVYIHWPRTKKSLHIVSVRSKNLQPTLITSIRTTVSGSPISLSWHFLLQSHNTNTHRGCTAACTDAPMSTRQKARIIPCCLLFIHLSRTRTFIGADQRRVSHLPPLQYATELWSTCWCSLKGSATRERDAAYA